MALPYLARLTLTLAAGAANLDAATRRRHVDWVLSRQRDDGGWAGREGDSDPYYTTFALRSLAIAGELPERAAEASAEFFRGRITNETGIVDRMSIVYGAALLELVGGIEVLPDHGPWRTSLIELFDTLRRDDGGFAKSIEGRAGSTYSTFLTVLTLQLLSEPIRQCAAIAAFLRGQRQVDGGYLEIRAAKRSGVNPTAAATGTMMVLAEQTDQPADSIDHASAAETLDFIADRQSDEGGLAANTRIPFADGLSTFTGLWTARDLTRIITTPDASKLSFGDRIDPMAAERFIRSLEHRDGGFVGFILDETADVEYTFYGLATLALLAAD